MKRFYILFAFLVIITAGLTVTAQNQQPPFVPVTDEMLWKPGPGQLADVAPNARQLGLQPAQRGQSQQRLAVEDGLDSRHRHRPDTGGHAARLQRHDVHPEPGRPHHGDGRQDRRSEVGVPAQVSRGRQRRHQPQHGDLGNDAHRRGRRQHRLRRRCADGQPGLGNAGASRSASAPMPAPGRSSPTAR